MNPFLGIMYEYETTLRDEYVLEQLSRTHHGSERVASDYLWLLKCMLYAVVRAMVR
jgi:hypothetical protein